MKMIFVMAIVFLSLSSHAQNELKINVMALTGADSQDELRIDRALEIIEGVVNTEEFKDAVVNMTYKIGKKTFNGYTQTSKTPRQILTSILEAKENFSGGSEGVIDLNLDMFYARSSTVGYTGPSDKFIHMNRYFHQHYSPVETARNIFHEWLHKINHGHSKKNNSSRPHSVPYKLGTLVAEMSAEFEANGDPVLKEMLIENMSESDLCSLHFE